MTGPQRYPWHQRQWDHFISMVQHSRLPHGLLLSATHGQEELGIDAFAMAQVNYLFCEQPNKPCHKCYSCRWFEQGNHPDFLLVEPEEGHAIKIEQIRQLMDWAMLSRHQSRYRIAVINHADHMNRSAANAFLKLLEEPPTHTLFILTGTGINRLPPTIRSRCQMIQFTSPKHEEGLDWLRQNLSGIKTSVANLSITDQQLTTLLERYNHAPLEVIRHLEDEDLEEKQELELHLQSLIHRDKLSPSDLDTLKRADSRWVFSELIYQYERQIRQQCLHSHFEEARKTLSKLDSIRQAQQQAISNNINTELLIEEILL